MGGEKIVKLINSTAVSTNGTPGGFGIHLLQNAPKW